MSIPAWPLTVNQDAFKGSVKEAIQANVSTFAPEVGAPLTRKRMAASLSTLTFDMPATPAEWTALDAFFRDDLQDGALSFTRDHPLTGSAITAVFTAPPSYEVQAPQLYKVAIALMRLA